MAGTSGVLSARLRGPMLLLWARRLLEVADLPMRMELEEDDQVAWEWMELMMVIVMQWEALDMIKNVQLDV